LDRWDEEPLTVDTVTKLRLEHRTIKGFYREMDGTEFLFSMFPNVVDFAFRFYWDHLTEYFPAEYNNGDVAQHAFGEFHVDPQSMARMVLLLLPYDDFLTKVKTMRIEQVPLACRDFGESFQEYLVFDEIPFDVCEVSFRDGMHSEYKFILYDRILCTLTDMSGGNCSNDKNYDDP
jgi:hypothetical protein